MSGQLQKEADFYASFVDGGRTVKEFCQQVVVRTVLCGVVAGRGAGKVSQLPLLNFWSESCLKIFIEKCYYLG